MNLNNLIGEDNMDIEENNIDIEEDNLNIEEDNMDIEEDNMDIEENNIDIEEDNNDKIIDNRFDNRIDNNIETILEDDKNHKPKVIYYYQTFCGLDKILTADIKVTHIHLAAIHFGYNNNVDSIMTPYIHLNNYEPEDPKFNSVWEQLKEAKKLGIKVILMIGGAGTAYQMLFSKYTIFYDLLKQTIKRYDDIIDGIDLDVEENIKLSQIRTLINDIDEDFGKDFIISMAPVQFTMENPNTRGMSGFKYSQLYKTYEGQRINYFNVQAYSSYSLSTLNNIINNGYSVEKIVMGMLTGQDYQNIKLELAKMSKKYKLNFGGVFIWEYYDAPPNGISDPSEWSKEIYQIIYTEPSIQEVFEEKVDSLTNTIKEFFYNIYYSNYFRFNR